MISLEENARCRTTSPFLIETSKKFFNLMVLKGRRDRYKQVHIFCSDGLLPTRVSDPTEKKHQFKGGILMKPDCSTYVLFFSTSGNKNKSGFPFKLLLVSSSCVTLHLSCLKSQPLKCFQAQSSPVCFLPSALLGVVPTVGGRSEPGLFANWWLFPDPVGV